MPAPGHFYLELRQHFATTAQGFDADGGRRRLSTTSSLGVPVAAHLYDAQTALYAELGLATRLALIADFAVLRSVSLTRPDERARSGLGLGDLRAGLRLVLLDEEVSCAIDAKLAIPTARSDGEVPLGPGDLRGEFTLSAGKTWDRIPFVVVVEVGARLRTSGKQRLAATSAFMTPTAIELDYASELTYALGLGYSARVGERLQLSPRISLDGRHGFSAPNDSAPALPFVDPLHPRSVRVLRLGASLGFGISLGGAGRQLRRIDVQVGGGAFVWGEGLPAAGEATLAVGLVR